MYYGEKFTDQRRKQEARQESRRQFESVCQQMPDLIKEMQENLAEMPHVRQFFVLPKGAELGGTASPAFKYYDSPDKPLQSWVQVLENHGYVVDITSKSTPKYRMTKEFVNLIQQFK